MSSKEPQNTEEGVEEVKSAPVAWLSALIIIMMGFLIFRMYSLLPNLEKRELSESTQYCLDELKASDIRWALERGAYISYTSEFIEEMRVCRDRLNAGEEG